MYWPMAQQKTCTISTACHLTLRILKPTWRPTARPYYSITIWPSCKTAIGPRHKRTFREAISAQCKISVSHTHTRRIKQQSLWFQNVTSSGERYPTLPHRSWLRHQTPPRVGVKRRGDARGRSRDTSRQVSLTQNPKRPDKSKGKGAWDCFVLEFNLNLFKAGRDLGLASKLSKCTLLMRSAGNSPASLINILHKHIDCRQEWVRCLRDRKIMTPVHVDSKDNDAYLFTKILSREPFEMVRNRIIETQVVSK